ncbi:hypothetical protein O9993_12140 [Vibrio lentus]|nr:hypothetical protein [Vibrio lentus]
MGITLVDTPYQRYLEPMTMSKATNIISTYPNVPLGARIGYKNFRRKTTLHPDLAAERN